MRSYRATKSRKDLASSLILPLFRPLKGRVGYAACHALDELFPFFPIRQRRRCRSVSRFHNHLHFSISLTHAERQSDHQNTIGANPRLDLDVTHDITSATGRITHAIVLYARKSNQMSGYPGELQSREFGRSTGILPVCHGQDGRATKDFAVLLSGYRR